MKRKLIPAELLTPWLDRLWAAAPPSVDRSDSSTWVEPAERWGPNSTDNHGPFTADGRSTSRDPHHLTPNSQWRAHVLGHDPEFVAATSGHPKLLHVVEQLLGGPLRKPTRNRGIYSCVSVSHFKLLLARIHALPLRVRLETLLSPPVYPLTPYRLVQDFPTAQLCG